MAHLQEAAEASACGDAHRLATAEHLEIIREAEKKDKWDSSSITKSYHRLRSEELRKFLDALEENQKEKLRIDARRVKKCRAKLEKSEKTKPLLDEVRESLDKWRTEAKGRGDAKLKYAVEERDVHQKGPDVLGVDDIVLENDADPEHDFKAGFLFFQKHESGWKKSTYHKDGFDEHEKFPNQKLTVHQALYDKQHNPIYETKDEDGSRHLKYIHLPANHMGWVEVSILTSHWCS